MRKYKPIKGFRYDDETGMSLFRASIIWCFALSLFIGVGWNYWKLSASISGLLIVVNVVCLIGDTVVRIVHYKERRCNEQVQQAQQVEQVGQGEPVERYVSSKEKWSYWAIRIGAPLFVAFDIVSSIVIGI